VAFNSDSTTPGASQIASDIDLRCAMAFARAALQTVCGLSAEAKAAALSALDVEAHSAAMDGGPDAEAVAAVLNEARQRLAAG
jgi:hypothetical protein